jgi:hypothetical protein
MGVPGNANPLLLRTVTAAATGISRSIRLNSADSAYLSRTPGSAGNRKTWTWAGWMKRTKSSSGLTYQSIFTAGIDGNNNSAILFDNSDRLEIWNVVGNVNVTQKITSQVFRDFSSWYHLVVSATTSTLSVYVNGVEVTAWSTNNQPGNEDWSFNTTNAHYLARYWDGGSSFPGDFYLADIYFIDGQALDPTSFGETDATTGVWNPKAYTGSYGTNGFHLEFADNSAATATTLGKDTSGNGNNFTPSNLSVTAGAGNDSLVDVPTNGAQTDTGVGNEVRGNYCTWNPLGAGTNVALSNGNLDATSNTNDWRQIKGTIGVTTGKWYWECTNTGSSSSTDNQYHGISNDSETPATNLGTVSGYCYGDSGDKYAAGTNTGGAGATYTNGDVIGMALDLDSGTQTIKFYKNGTLQFTQNISGSGPWYPASNCYYSQTGPIFVSNFGQRAFAYPLSGFKALCTTNLPAPSVTKGSSVMDVKLYTGNGSTQNITGLGFNPDFVWLKSRNSGSYSHNIYDAVRGATKIIYSDSTSAENTDASGLTAFNSDGFSLGSTAATNASSTTYVGWCWDAGTSTVTNTAGSISSQVRANTTAGFSIVTYSGNGTSGATVGHGGLVGLDKGMIIVKTRTGASVANWMVYHGALGATKVMEGLNTTSAASTSSASWNDTAPTSTVFTLGNESNTNGSGRTFVAYCFAPVAGYSSFGSYTGNGATGWPNADGPFIYLGFRPRFVLWKCTSQVENWVIYDSARETYNFVNDKLLPNSSAAESTNNNHEIDFLSNGFKIRNNNGEFNQNAGTYIYAAFAESPFNYARAR